MFNVGDIITTGRHEYTVDALVTEDRVIVRDMMGTLMSGHYNVSMFTLVTPAVPPTPVLTGMTQFFKDKEKNNEASI